MEKEPDQVTSFKAFVQWATTPPQAYATYVICLFLVTGISFYAGTLNPKKVPPPPQSASVPRN